MKIKALLLSVILSFMSFSVFAEVVNLNKADAAAFQYYLKGIGEKKAKDIVAYRKEHKSFKTIEEIMQVKGIGEGIFKKIKADLSLTKGVVSAPAKKKVAKKKAEEAKPATKEKKTTAKKEDTAKSVKKEAKAKKAPAKNQEAKAEKDTAKKS